MNGSRYKQINKVLETVGDRQLYTAMASRTSLNQSLIKSTIKKTQPNNPN
jgi:hypothetical protein